MPLYLLDPKSHAADVCQNGGKIPNPYYTSAGWVCGAAVEKTELVFADVTPGNELVVFIFRMAPFRHRFAVFSIQFREAIIGRSGAHPSTP